MMYDLIPARPSSAVRPVRPWPDHFFGRKWFWPDPFFGRLYFLYFLPGNFSPDKILSNNINIKGPSVNVFSASGCEPQSL